MARVHLFSSLTSTPHSRHSPSPEYDALTEDPALPSKDSESHNITISVTQEEGTQVESSAASPSTKNIENDNTTSSEAVEQEKTALTNELTSSSAALTAALLQNAHGNNDMAGAVAAALSSVKPGKHYKTIKVLENQFFCLFVHRIISRTNRVVIA